MKQDNTLKREGAADTLSSVWPHEEKQSETGGWDSSGVFKKL